MSGFEPRLLKKKKKKNIEEKHQFSTFRIKKVELYN